MPLTGPSRSFWRIALSLADIKNLIQQNILTEMDPNLTKNQSEILSVIYDLQPVSLIEISTVLNLNYGNTSTHVKQLTQMGMVESQRSQEDERVIKISLTKYGETIFKAYLDKITDLLADYINSKSDSELDTIEDAIFVMDNFAKSMRTYLLERSQANE